MKREQIAETLARQGELSSAAARDEVDELIHKILKKLRRGESVKLPGLGQLTVPPVKTASRRSSR